MTAVRRNSIFISLYELPFSFFSFSLFMNKPDRAGRTELAVNFRVTAFQTVPAHIDIVLHAHERGFSVKMKDTFSHKSKIPFLT